MICPEALQTLGQHLEFRSTLLTRLQPCTDTHRLRAGRRAGLLWGGGGGDSLQAPWVIYEHTTQTEAYCTQHIGVRLYMTDIRLIV